MNNDYYLYQQEDIRYKDFTNILFFYQKYKDNPWNKGENFGDYLSKIIVGEIAISKGFKKAKSIENKLLGVGSILHFANTNDIIWGSGINGKIGLDRLTFNNLNIKSVRGPLTKEILENKGLSVPDIFGDPALLMPKLFPSLKYSPMKNKITVIPNLNEFEEVEKIISKKFNLISPLKHWNIVFNEILTSEIVYTSSLHGLIICEAFNIPVILFKPFGGETLFKYEDYLEGTGRKLNRIPKTFNEGINENNGIVLKSPKYKIEEILNQFPNELFTKDIND